MHERSSWEEFFDAHASIYDQNEFTKNTIKEVDFLLEELGLSPGAAILDVGCGTGRHSIELARRGYVMTGVDLSTQMLARARESASAAKVHVEWIHGDATRLSLARRFEGAICLCEGAFGLLGAGDDPILQPLAILRNISRSLKPQAMALFTVLNGSATMRKYQIKDVEDGRFDPLTMTETSDHAPREGWSKIRLRERSFIPTELSLLFPLAGMTVLNIWGGTAGNWGRRKIDPDEIEIMIVSRKTSEPGAATFPV
jgi:SAM-dependent methyltransferase